MNNDNYRKCVGMMILNNNKEILVGKRLDHPSGFWQMPQGGIDEKENPEEAVWREMMEEIGTNKAELLKVSEASVSDIAWQTGFNDVAHFSRSFKSVHQLSPKAYRAQFAK